MGQELCSNSNKKFTSLKKNVGLHGNIVNGTKNSFDNVMRYENLYYATYSFY